MSTSFSSVGIRRMWRRRGLVAGIYLLGLALALLVGSGVFRLLAYEIGPTGFSQRLLESFDLVLWADFWKGIAPGLAAVTRQAIVAGLMIMVWKLASGVGLVHALQGDGRSSFWEGVGRYTVRALGLGALYVLPLLLLVGILTSTVAAIAEGMGEVGTFWIWGIVYPLVVVTLVGTFDLFHDYGRMHLVLRAATVRHAWLEGIRWPMRHFKAVLLYKLWFWISAILWFSVLVIGFYLPDETVAAVVVAFFLQQLLIVGRTAVSVSWVGAQVAYFEDFSEPGIELPGEFVDLSVNLEEDNPPIGIV